jgi:hypothetical protein
VYRASFLAHERFGTGRPTRRHPAAGLIDAGPVAFAYEITAQVTAQEVTDG